MRTDVYFHHITRLWPRIGSVRVADRLECYVVLVLHTADGENMRAGDTGIDSVSQCVQRWPLRVGSCSWGVGQLYLYCIPAMQYAVRQFATRAILSTVSIADCTARTKEGNIHYLYYYYEEEL